MVHKMTWKGMLLSTFWSFY